MTEALPCNFVIPGDSRCAVFLFMRFCDGFNGESIP